MKMITSVHNQEIKDVVQLHQAKYRKQRQEFIAEGQRVCATLIDAGYQPINLFCTELMQDYAFELCPTITLVADHVMEKISPVHTPSGIVGIFKIPKPHSLDTLTQGIVLAQIQDPGNMGTLIRTAAALALKTVVIIEGCDPWSPKVIQSTAGTIASVTIYQCSWQELLNNKKNLSLCALIVHGGKSFHDLNFNNTLLIVGNEANGLPQEWINTCNQQLTLAMPGQTESLNAAIAGSIALYLAFGLTS